VEDTLPEESVTESRSANSRPRRETSAERAYTQLKRDLTDGRYRPNQRLVELELAEDLRASRTPIRQALHRLQLQGFVEPSPHGWIVKDHSMEEILHIYEVRIALESEASRLAAERSSADELGEMRTHLDGLMRAGHADDISAFVRSHDAFHAAIVEASRNPILTEAVRVYRDHPYNRRVAHRYRQDDLTMANESHAAMFEAIQDRRVSEAVELTREHLGLSRSVTVRTSGGDW
jgi:DNA-binding GntR family transcriptional regulator